jgi:hypothetical protein
VATPYQERRAALEELQLRGRAWRTTPIAVGADQVEALYRVALEWRIEGLVAKARIRVRARATLALVAEDDMAVGEGRRRGIKPPPVGQALPPTMRDQTPTAPARPDVGL